MGNVYSLDLHRAMRRTGKTQRQFASAVHVSHETLRGWLYRGRLTGLPTLYHIADVAGELVIHGPNGPMVLVPLDDRTPPPGAPAQVAHDRRAA